MQILRLSFLLFSAVIMLSGFTWGFGTDKCKKALELSQKLTTLKDADKVRKAEAEILALCPNDAAGDYVNALQLERVGNIDGALAGYKKALQSEPSFAQASGNLGLLYAKKGMKDDASIELSKGLASGDPRYHKALAELLAENKMYPLAAYHFNTAANGLPNDLPLFTGLAEAYVASNQPDKAADAYGKALAIDPKSEKALVGIASLYVDKDPLRALGHLKNAAAVNPQNRDTHLMLASIYEKSGKSREANYEYQLAGVKPLSVNQSANSSSSKVDNSHDSKATAMDADLANDVANLKNAIKDNPNSVALYDKLAKTYYLAGKDSEAIAASKDAIYHNSSASDTYLHLGMIYEKRNMQDEAVVVYKQSVRVAPKSTDARLRLADIYMSRGSNAQAVEQYGEFLKLKPNNPQVQIKLARIFARTNETNLAIEGYQAVLKQSPDNLDANREVAALYKNKGMNDKAIDYYKRALELQRDDMETRNALVSLYVKNKQYDEISELLKGAVEIAPDDANNHYKLGLIYDFKKDTENAVTSYKKAIELKPDHARALNALGRLYMKSGRKDEAKEMLEAAKKADPNLEEAAVLLSNVGDSFNPVPHKISSKYKSRSVKKGKKHKSSKSSATTKSKATKSKGTKSKKTKKS